MHREEHRVGRHTNVTVQHCEDADGADHAKTGQQDKAPTKLTAKIQVGYGSIQFNAQATRVLCVWMDTHLTFEEHHNRCMKKARAAEPRLRLLTEVYGVVPGSIRAVQVPCVQAVAHYVSELWLGPWEVGRRDDLQLLLNRQSRSILGTVPTTRGGALMREPVLTHVPVTIDS